MAAPHFVKRRIRKNYVWKHFFVEYKPYLIGLGVLLVLVLCRHPWFAQYSDLFKASLIDYDRVVFEGASMPVKKVPDWVALTDAERKMHYSQLPASKLIDLPKYNVPDLKAGKNWSSSTPAQRNAYITYPVPNLGNYQLDGSENTGSHPGVDIKLPIGTPIYAIANGIVEKAENQENGFGLHVVLRHPNVPDSDNPGQKVTLFSGYAHLSQMSVRKGAEVKKGQLIGNSGDSGFATAPHLHFQIDRFGAPYHLHWPFSWKDVQDAGYSSYFEAVKNGLKKSEAQRHTVHPINFVTQNLNYQNLVVSTQVPAESLQVNANPSAPKPEPEPEVKEPEPEEKIVVETTPIPEKIEEPTVRTTESPSVAKPVEINFDTDLVFTPGVEKYITVKVENLVASSSIQLDSTLRGLATVSPSTIQGSGNKTVKVTTDSFRDFRLVASGDFGTVKSDVFQAKIFTDIPADHAQADGIKYLKELEVVKGYNDGTFLPNKTLVRAEALKIILLSNRIATSNNATDFSDVATGDWFAPYVSSAVEQGIVGGYPDGTFKPSKTMTRAEFLKVAIKTAGFSVADSLDRAPYEDVPAEAWFAPYFFFVKVHNLLHAPGGSIYPAKEITRGEAADIIYKLSKIKR